MSVTTYFLGKSCGLRSLCFAALPTTSSVCTRIKGVRIHPDSRLERETDTCNKCDVSGASPLPQNSERGVERW